MTKSIWKKIVINMKMVKFVSGKQKRQAERQMSIWGLGVCGISMKKVSHQDLCVKMGLYFSSNNYQYGKFCHF